MTIFTLILLTIVTSEVFTAIDAAIKEDNYSKAIFLVIVMALYFWSIEGLAKKGK